MSPAVSSSVKAVLDLTSKRLSPAIQRSSPLFFLQPHLYSSYCSRSFSHSIRRSATPLPTGAAAGPPPSAPTPAASHYGDRIGRRRKQAELLQRAKEARASQTSREGSSTQKKAIPLKRRFWDRVYVKSIKADGSTADDSEGDAAGGYRVYLDDRPLRAPDKTIMTVPGTKPHLAEMIALEWDQLTSAQQALKSHKIPLTSLTWRANEIQRQDDECRRRGEKEGQEISQIRSEIVDTLMRYLDTDTLLFIEADEVEEAGPAERPVDLSSGDDNSSLSLGYLQKKSAMSVISYLTSNIWWDVSIYLNTRASILPSKQSAETKARISHWLSHSLSAYELAGLERAALATKSLLIAARLVVEWSPRLKPPFFDPTQNQIEGLDKMEKENGIVGAQSDTPSTTSAEAKIPLTPSFGILEAADAATVEVRHQISRWGEVEDTHDVDREDLRRQLGSVVCLVSATR